MRGLQDAREARKRLEDQFSRIHERHQLRREYQRLLDAGQRLLSQIEQATHHRPGHALQQALDKLRQADGKLATALREDLASKGSHSSWGSLTSRGPSHSESLTSADRLLQEAFAELHSASATSTALSSVDVDSFAVLSQDDGTPEQTGVLTQYKQAVGGMWGNIAAVCLQPGPSGTIGSLVAALNSVAAVQLDLFAGCKPAHYKSHSLAGKQDVTCMTFDADSSTVWTGHADGSIKVHRMKHGMSADAADLETSLAVQYCQQGRPVSSLAIEAQSEPRCWAGDVDGRVVVLKLTTTHGSHLHLLHNTTVLPWENQRDPPSYLPVRALLQLGQAMLVSGGASRPGSGPAHRLQLWDCKQHRPVKEFWFRFDEVTCLELLGTGLLITPQPSGRQTPAAAGRLEPVSSYRSSGSESGSSFGGSSGRVRLLSGHAAGQVVLWELVGRGAAAELRELAVIGEHKDQRVVKGVFAFPQWDMLVVATSSPGINNLGKLRLTKLPTDAQLALAADRHQQAMATPHKVQQPTVDLPVANINAHTQALQAATCLEDALVTASASTIRLWSPAALARLALKCKPSIEFTKMGRASSSGASTDYARRASEPGGTAGRVLQSGAAAGRASEPGSSTAARVSDTGGAGRRVSEAGAAGREALAAGTTGDNRDTARRAPDEALGPLGMSRTSESPFAAAQRPQQPQIQQLLRHSQQQQQQQQQEQRSSQPSPRQPTPPMAMQTPVSPSSMQQQQGPPLSWQGHSTSPGVPPSPRGVFGGQPAPGAAPPTGLPPGAVYVGYTPAGGPPAGPYIHPYVMAAAAAAEAAAVTGGGAGQHGWAHPTPSGAAAAAGNPGHGWVGPLPVHPAAMPSSPPGMYPGMPSLSGGQAVAGRGTPSSWQDLSAQHGMTRPQQQQQQMPQPHATQLHSPPAAAAAGVRGAMDAARRPRGAPPAAAAGGGFDSAGSFHADMPETHAAAAAAGPTYDSAASFHAGARGAPGFGKGGSGKGASSSTAAAGASSSSGGTAGGAGSSQAQGQAPGGLPGPNSRQGINKNTGKATEQGDEVPAQLLQQGCQQEVAAAAAAEEARQREADVQSDIVAELSAHCSYQFLSQLPDQSLFGSSRALQVRCTRTHRLRTLLQVPRVRLQHLDAWGLNDEFLPQLVAASSVQHPHMVQVQEVFVGPLHLNIVLEECSAGKLRDYPATQARLWGSTASQPSSKDAAAAAAAGTTAAGASGASAAAAAAAGGAEAKPARLAPNLARWYFQQVVLAADYYHTQLGNSTGGGAAPQPSMLAIKDVMLKVAPNLPQPVVKVPTTVLAHGLDAFDLSSSSNSSIAQPGADPFIPPEAYASQYAGAQRHDTPAGDVWACGVLLLSLLGGLVNPQVYSIGSSPKAARVRDTDLFHFPGQQQAQAASLSAAQHSSVVSTDLKGLLTGMLQPCPSNRTTLQGLQQHSWFAEGLPPTARTMTQRFIDAGRKGRVCRTSVQEIEALVLAAAAAGPEAPLALLQQLHGGAAAVKAQSQAPQQQHELQLLRSQGSVSAELLYGLQLQLHVLQQTYIQLQGLSTPAMGSSIKRPSASNLTETLVAQDAAAYAAACVSSMARAVRKLRLLPHLQQQKLLLRGLGSNAAGPGLQGLALQLQYACSTALFSTSRLQLLLRSTEAPYDWHQLHKGIPAGDTKGAGRWERQQHMLKLQVYLLLHAQQCLHSMWACTATAAALADACRPARRQRRRETPAGRDLLRACPAAHLLTAVLGSWPRALQHLLPLAAVGLQGSRTVLGHLVLSLLMALVQANKVNSADASADFQRHEWRRMQRRAAVQLVNCVEELRDVQVDKQPCTGSSGSASSCVTYEGQVPQAKVVVVALAGLLPLDPTQQLPKERLKAREELVRKAHPLPDGYRCIFCAEMMRDAVHAEDGRDYCEACIERHRRTCAAAGEPAMSPFNKQVEIKVTPTPNFNLRESIADKCRELDQQRSRLLQEEQLQWKDAGSTAVPASQHLGIAHAPQPRTPGSVSTLRQLMVKLQAAGLLSGVPAASSSSTAAAGSSTEAGSSTQQQQQQHVLEPLAPINTVCSSPLLLVLPPPPAGTLQQWISSRASTLSSSNSDAGDFTAAWVRDLPWPLLLQLLGDVAAGLSGLHQQQPAVVHGGVHAGAVHLLEQLSSTHQQQQPSSSQQQQQQQQGSAGRRAQLSLVNLLGQLATVSSCHPFLAAPESQLSSAAATPAADVYGFGMLMFQVASGWLPQQFTPGTNDQVSAVLWSRKMLAQASSTSPLAAVQALAQPQPPPTPPQQQQQRGQAPSKDVAPLPVPPLLSAHWTPYGRHLLSSRALQCLPPGYVSLMEQCLHSVAPARPCMQAVAAHLQDIAQGRVAGAQQQQQQRLLMLEAMRVVEQHQAAGATGV